MSIDGAELPPGRLPGSARAALVAAAGPGGLRDDRGARIRHAAGRGYPDPLRLRAGRVDPAPDAVATPADADADAVAAVLEVCSGQASTGYGRIDELLRGVELVAPGPRGPPGQRRRTRAAPARGRVGGVLGVIVSADVEVCQRPLTRHYEGWALAGFREGADALRTLVQAGAAPEVARLSDEAETQTTLMLSGGT